MRAFLVVIPAKAGIQGLSLLLAWSPGCRLRSGRFDRLPTLESLFFCWPTHAQERMRTAKPARRAKGRMPGVKEK